MITVDQYEAFKLNWITTNRGKHDLGESFCAHFMIVDDNLYHEKDDDEADKFIRAYIINNSDVFIF